LESFHIASGTTRRGDCKECRNAKSSKLYKRDAHRIRRVHTAWYERNRGERIAQTSAWAKANPEKFAEYQKRYNASEKGKERRARQAASRRAATTRRKAEKLAALREQWAREGKACTKCSLLKPLSDFPVDSRYLSGRHSQCIACRLLQAREHKRRRKAWMADAKVDYAVVLARHGMLCHFCSGKIDGMDRLDFDHVEPLALGGSHCEENLRPSHSSCNRSRGAAIAAEVRRRGGESRDPEREGEGPGSLGENRG
jgi:5-methylcytosine-specific restriction endonuclease McrA